MQSEWQALVKAAARRLRKQYAEREQALISRRARAQEFARRLAAQLGGSDERIERVIGFGSTFETWRNYRFDSDIDLAFIGSDWFAITKDIPQSEFEVSLVELEDQGEEFRLHVLEHGEVLYEKR